MIRSYADDHRWLFSLGDSEIRRDLLYQAVDSLMSLDNGNMRAEKCAQYILRLDRVFDSPCEQRSCLADGVSARANILGPGFLDPANRPEINALTAPVDSLLHEGPRTGSGAIHPDTSHHEQTPFELDFSELMVPGDLDFLKYFEPSLNVS